ncbi:MFS transporter [Kitasatospora sp. NPDC059571]|uniref:MFS transporter n=1 Tax=Kitasatospora sp. NPDC059571 TaxID=3346871 RepID=UPI0036C654CB
MSRPWTPAHAPERLPGIVGTSLLGTTIEWYDFFVYTIASTTVLGPLFFPASDRLTGVLLSLLTYAVGFVARPLGAVVFGHFGDLYGRKKLLVVSLMSMGGATTLIGCLPTYTTVGVAAPVLLTVLRLLQGFALGGEWAGAVLMISERAAPGRRGFLSSWPQGGAALGFVLAAGSMTAMNDAWGPAVVQDFAWRLPFLASSVLLSVGVWMRILAAESPFFRQALQDARAREAATGLREPHPVLGVLRFHRRELLAAAGIRIAENVSFYVVGTFVITYGVTVLGLAQRTVLDAVLIAAVVEFALTPLFGALSDRVGRRPVFLFGALGTAVWAWAFFALVDTRSFPLIVAATTVGLAFHSAMYAPQAAYVSELFATRVRYTGASVGTQFASLVAGAPAPLIAVALLGRYRASAPISLYVTVCCAVTVVTVLFARETRHRDLARIPAGPTRHRPSRRSAPAGRP